MSTLLNEAISHGILDLAVIERQMNAMKRQEYLNQHHYKIYQNKDGRWCTYLPGRKRIQSKFKESLEDAIVEYYKQAEENPTVGDIFTEWNSKRLSLGRIKASTATRFDHDYEKFFESFGSRHIRSIVPGDISDFLEEQLVTHNLTRKAFANLKTLTKGIFKRARRVFVRVFERSAGDVM